MKIWGEVALALIHDFVMVGRAVICRSMRTALSEADLATTTKLRNIAWMARNTRKMGDFVSFLVVSGEVMVLNIEYLRVFSYWAFRVYRGEREDQRVVFTELSAMTTPWCIVLAKCATSGHKKNFPRYDARTCL